MVVAARQGITCEIWPRLIQEYELVISLPVIDEISRGDKKQAQTRLKAIQGVPVLEVSAQVKALAQNLVQEGAIPSEYPEDALHAAVAAFGKLFREEQKNAENPPDL